MLTEHPTHSNLIHNDHVSELLNSDTMATHKHHFSPIEGKTPSVRAAIKDPDVMNPRILSSDPPSTAAPLVEILVPKHADPSKDHRDMMRDRLYGNARENRTLPYSYIEANVHRSNYADQDPPRWSSMTKAEYRAPVGQREDPELLLNAEDRSGKYVPIALRGLCMNHAPEVARFTNESHFSLEGGECLKAPSSMTQRDFHWKVRTGPNSPQNNYSKYPPIYREEGEGCSLNTEYKELCSETNVPAPKFYDSKLPPTFLLHYHMRHRRRYVPEGGSETPEPYHSRRGAGRMRPHPIEPSPGGGRPYIDQSDPTRSHFSFGSDGATYESVTRAAHHRGTIVAEGGRHVFVHDNWRRSGVLDNPDGEKPEIKSVQQLDFALDTDLDRKDLMVDTEHFVKDLKATHFTLGNVEKQSNVSQYQYSFKNSPPKTADLPGTEHVARTNKWRHVPFTEEDGQNIKINSSQRQDYKTPSSYETKKASTRPATPTAGTGHFDAVTVAKESAVYGKLEGHPSPEVIKAVDVHSSIPLDPPSQTAIDLLTQQQSILPCNGPVKVPPSKSVTAIDFADPKTKVYVRPPSPVDESLRKRKVMAARNRGAKYDPISSGFDDDRERLQSVVQNDYHDPMTVIVREGKIWKENSTIADLVEQEKEVCGNGNGVILMARHAESNKENAESKEFLRGHHFTFGSLEGGGGKGKKWTSTMEHFGAPTAEELKIVNETVPAGIRCPGYKDPLDKVQLSREALAHVAKDKGSIARHMRNVEKFEITLGNTVSRFPEMPNTFEQVSKTTYRNFEESMKDPKTELPAAGVGLVGENDPQKRHERHLPTWEPQDDRETAAARMSTVTMRSFLPPEVSKYNPLAIRVPLKPDLLDNSWKHSRAVLKGAVFERYKY